MTRRSDEVLWPLMAAARNQNVADRQCGRVTECNGPEHDLLWRLRECSCLRDAVRLVENGEKE